MRLHIPFELYFLEQSPAVYGAAGPGDAHHNSHKAQKARIIDFVISKTAFEHMSCSENRTNLLECKYCFGLIGLFQAQIYAIIHPRPRRPSFLIVSPGCADSIIAWMMRDRSCAVSVND